MSAGLARATLRLAGWTVVGEPVEHSKYVLIGAPHTSNWDFPLGLLAMTALRVRWNWVGKHTLFRGPAGWLMRRLGGIPLDRTARHNFVDQVVQAFAENDEMVISITPEGTRSRVEYWKTGFYYIACGAAVPIVLGFADYATKRVGIGGIVVPSGDIEADIATIRAFYADKTGLRPEKQGPIRVRSAGVEPESAEE